MSHLQVDYFYYFFLVRQNIQLAIVIVTVTLY